MRLVTFNELVPGMVLHPAYDVNSKGEVPEDYERAFGEIIILMEAVPAGESRFFGDSRALHYIQLNDAYQGSCWSSWRTEDKDYWEVIDDEETLAKARAYVKTQVNKHRDHLTTCERFVDDNL